MGTAKDNPCAMHWPAMHASDAVPFTERTTWSKGQGEARLWCKGGVISRGREQGLKICLIRDLDLLSNELLGWDMVYCLD